MKCKFIITLLTLIIFGTSLSASDIYKIEDLYKNNIALENKTISVNGKVVKISAMIMDKDWIHVQDDSTTPNKNKVIFTAKPGTVDIKVGDMVTATGMLKAKVDIGAGYFYEVLIENSTFSK